MLFNVKSLFLTQEKGFWKNRPKNVFIPHLYIMKAIIQLSIIYQMFILRLKIITKAGGIICQSLLQMFADTAHPKKKSPVKEFVETHNCVGQKNVAPTHFSTFAFSIVAAFGHFGSCLHPVTQFSMPSSNTWMVWVSFYTCINTRMILSANRAPVRNTGSLLEDLIQYHYDTRLSVVLCGLLIKEA